MKNYPKSHLAAKMGPNTITGFGWVYPVTVSGMRATDRTVCGKITLNVVTGIGVICGHRIGKDIPAKMRGELDIVFSLANKQVNFTKKAV